MEGVLGLATMSRRIGQRADHLLELHKRPRPTVDQHQRQGILVPGPLVDEVQVHAVDVGLEVRPSVESLLLGPPVVLGLPVPDEFLEIAEVGAIGPVGVRDPIGIPGQSQATAEILEQMLAAEAGGIFPLIRLPDGERHHILRSLEIGARIILVPMVDDANHARRIVDAGKYPPIGHRGFNTRTRGMGFGMHDLTDILARANARTHLFAQIETTEAVAHIDEILAVDGLSGIFMGPGDLAVSMGRAGQIADPELRETVLTCMAKAKAAGKLTGIFTLPGPLLSAAMQAGCDLVVCGGDVMDLGTAWSKLLGQIPTEGG